VLTLLATVALAIGRPPPAHLALGRVSAPLAISSWWWHGKSGAPITASTRVAVVPRGYDVTCVLTFQPTKVQLTVGGHPVPAIFDGAKVLWRAQRAGGITLRVDSSAGWIVYVGRIALKRA
jgi:hypothetical protein